MDIVVSGRNLEVPDHYRQLVSEKLDRVSRYDHKIIRVDVELHHEKNRRQAAACQHVEITCRTRGPVVRAEACAADFYAALDAAVGKLDERFRRAADRRRVHRGHHRPASVADAVSRVDAAGPEPLAGIDSAHPTGSLADATHPDTEADDATDAGETESGDAQEGPGRVVRRKDHTALPMSVEQALFEMELVGHDFYLFCDAETGLASVVYRRRGYDYGLIRLTALALDKHVSESVSHNAVDVDSDLHLVTGSDG